MQVLIVEDEVRLAEALAHIMKEEKYLVDTVHTGTDGLEYARSGLYDVVILDVMLPGLSGFEIIKRLRTEKIDTPVIMLTAKDETADKVREILTTLYHDQPDGLSGNEDVGQMSAWYVLSSLGFYQVEPAGGRYFFGSPLFDKAELRVRDGVFTVIAHNNSAADKYIQRVKLNGEPYAKPYIGFEEIAAGGTLEFEMGPEPAVWYEL